MTGTAFGKLILLGEHAVVFGVPALAVGIERGAKATAATGRGATSTLRVGGEDPVEADDRGSDLSRAFARLLAACGATSALDLHVTTDLPAGAGLGCSAALGVAIARATSRHLGHTPTLEETIEHAMEWERVFHGNPSGVDATVAARGGAIRFLRGERPQEIRLRAPLSIAIGNTGIASSTKVMVDAVARLRERRPEQVEKSFEGIRALVDNARLALEAGDEIGLGKLLDLNQMLLSGLMVSSTEIERMCDLARGAGALGAKLTGAGGGGCVMALCAGSAEHVLDAWQRAGFTAFATVVGAESAPQSEATHATP